MARIFVGMSGGVDSSVAAALLLEAGHEVVGVTLALLPEDTTPDTVTEGCCDAAGARRARAVADTLGIPHYTWNAREAFAAGVLEPFARGYARGETPNPCAACNDVIKFGWFLDRSIAAGADALATGHYARILAMDDPANPGLHLARGVDPERDQSYFLYRLGPDRLARTLFPLGELTKTRVRAIAAERGLAAADAPESRETCFAPDGDYTRVVAARCPEALEPGDIVTLDGRVLGRHQGVARYTVGQRKGLALADGPWFVVRLEPEVRRVVVGRAEDLGVTAVVAREPVWYGAAPTGAQAGLRAQYRYRGPVVPLRIDPRGEAWNAEPGELRLEFAEPVTGVARGQAVVVYEGESVLVGGVVSETA